VQFELEVGGAPVQAERDVKYRYEGNIFSGEKRMDLTVVPRLAVTLTPDIAILPESQDAAASRRPAGHELRVTRDQRRQGPGRGHRLARGAGRLDRGAAERDRVVRARRRGAAGAVHRDAPARRETGLLRRESRRRVGRRPFHERVPGGGVSAHARRHLVTTAESTFKIINVAIAPRLNVGYVMGVGDQVPPAIEQLGARVTLIDADGLALWRPVAVRRHRDRRARL